MLDTKKPYVSLLHHEILAPLVEIVGAGRDGPLSILSKSGKLENKIGFPTSLSSLWVRFMLVAWSR